AFMQNVGVVNDHVQGCFRGIDYRTTAGAVEDRPRRSARPCAAVPADPARLPGRGGAPEYVGLVGGEGLRPELGPHPDLVTSPPLVPRHCHPRARLPVPRCSEVPQPGPPSCLVGCRKASIEELMMRVFVAGATGAIGKQLVPRLVAAGHEVHGMTRSESKQAMLDELGAVPVVADALDPGQVAQAVARAEPEVIVHQLTALGAIDLRDFERAFARTNRLRTEGTDYLLSAGQAVGARRFVAQSNGAFPYARTGGAVKGEEDPLDPAPAREMRAMVAAIRHL